MAFDPALAVDFKFRGLPVVSDVEMRGMVIPVVHLDHDPIKTGNFRHERAASRGRGRVSRLSDPSF